MKQARCATLVCALLAALAAMQVSPCQQPHASAGAAPGQQNARPLSADEQSCKAFVQKFYDWYWNQPPGKADSPRYDWGDVKTVDGVLGLNPPVLSQGLIRLIRKDEAASKAAGGEVVNLGFDPFLNSNGPVGKYTVKNASVVDGFCRATIEGGHGIHEVAELKKTSSVWIFVNFYYFYYSEDGREKEFPDDNLIHILSR